MKLTSIFLSFLLSTLILFNSLNVSLTYAYYELDPIGFIEKLCENKDQPELECNGKCHLKKVSESTNKNNNEPTRIIDFKEILLYTQKVDNYVFQNSATIEKESFNYNNLYKFTSLNTCFRPPQV